MSYEIVISVGGLILGEIIYLAICRNATKKHLIEENNWVAAKILAFMLGFIVSGCIYGVYLALRNYIIETILIALGISLYIGFMYLNKYMGLAIAKKR